MFLTVTLIFMEERGVKIDHSTLNRRVINYLCSLVFTAKKCKRTVATLLRMDGIKGKWVYLYRAVDKFATLLICKYSPPPLEKGD
jgi:putative transposase